MNSIAEQIHIERFISPLLFLSQSILTGFRFVHFHHLLAAKTWQAANLKRVFKHYTPLIS
jgi:hypothetical protein